MGLWSHPIFGINVSIRMLVLAGVAAHLFGCDRKPLTDTGFQELMHGEKESGPVV
jgi:hypothetical protein